MMLFCKGVLPERSSTDAGGCPMGRGVSEYGGTPAVRCWIPAVCGVFLAFAAAGMQMYRGYGLWHAASDGCFAAGALLFGIGVLKFVSGKGVFDLAFYGFSRTLPFRSEERRNEDFHAYRRRKRAQQTNTRTFLIPGAALLVLSVAALFLIM